MAKSARRQSRKEARQAKKQKNNQSWLTHQKSQKFKSNEKSKRTFVNSESKYISNLNNASAQNFKKRDNRQEDANSRRNRSSEEMNMPVNLKVKSDSLSHKQSAAPRMMKVKKGLKKKSKTKFEEYLEMDTKYADRLAEEDLEMERILAKKLKVKDGKLRGTDDGINSLFKVISSVINSFDEEFPDSEEISIERPVNGTFSKKCKKPKSLEERSEDEIDYIDHEQKSLDELSEDEIDDDEQKPLEELSEDEIDEDNEQNFLEELSDDEIDEDDEQMSPEELPENEIDEDDEQMSLEELPEDEINDDYDDQKSLEEVSEDRKNDDDDIKDDDSEKYSAEMEGSTDTPLHKKRRKRKKSKKKQLGGVTGDAASDVSEPEESHEEELPLQKIPNKLSAVAGSVKYIAPHLRSHAGNESEEHTQIRRRVRGLLNRLSESNVESVTGEMVTIFRSVSRSASSQIISNEVLAATSGGPRGSERHAAVFAAFVGGMACSVGMDFSAKLMASLAKSFEVEYRKEDNLSLRNLTLLLSYLYIFGVCSSDLIYDFLITLSKRLTEVDVSTILTVLNCCGMKIRGDDPTAMINFIQSIQNRVNELRTSSTEGQAKINGKRMEFMLETICDIKNNKKRPKEETATLTRIKKWLQKLRVEEVMIRGLKWSKLLDPDKKGQWWLSGNMANMAATTENVEEVANTIDKEVLEAQKMMQLAASQRMNTDVRRAIFCIIMSGEDYIDAFEKLLRLDLHGQQDREIIRVIVECCLQEKVFNKYYTVLASKICEYNKRHRFTLELCLRDHFRELESMELLRSMHLAKFVAEMVSSFTLSLAVLKTVELSDASELTPKRIMHFRMVFEAIFEYSDKIVWNVFTRVAVTPELEMLRDGINFFIGEYVAKPNKAMKNKFKIAKKALNNAEGVLM